MVGKAKAVGGSGASIDYLREKEIEQEKAENEKNEKLKDESQQKETSNLKLRAEQELRTEVVKVQRDGYELARNGIIGEKGSEIMRELKQWNESNPAQLKNKVFSMVVSPSVADGQELSDNRLLEIGRSFMAKTLNINPDKQPYYMYVHTDKEHKHIHIYTPRSDEHGKTISDHNIHKSAHIAAASIAKEYGLENAHEIQKVRMMELKTRLQQITNSSQIHSFAEYKEAAAAKEIEIKPTINKQGELQGYNIVYKKNQYKASDIDRKLSLTALAKEGKLISFDNMKLSLPVQQALDKAIPQKIFEQVKELKIDRGHSMRGM